MTEPADERRARAPRADATTRPAPPPLDLVQALVNTLNKLRGYDLLADVAAAREWLADVAPELDPAGLTESDLPRLVQLREGLRGLLRSATSGAPLDAWTIGTLREAGRRHRPAVVVDPDGTARLEAPPDPEHPADELMERLLAALPAAEAAGSRGRLKACANPACEWAFYDSSRSRSGSWCVMNICGARHKMARYREGRADADGQAGSGPGLKG